MMDPTVQVLALYTDNRKRNLYNVVLTFYGTKEEAKMLEADIKAIAKQRETK